MEQILLTAHKIREIETLSDFVTIPFYILQDALDVPFQHIYDATSSQYD